MSRNAFTCPTRFDERRNTRWADHQRDQQFTSPRLVPRQRRDDHPAGAGRDRGKNSAGATLATRSLSGRVSPAPTASMRGDVD